MGLETAIIASMISAGGSLAGGALNSRKSTSSTTPTYTPQQSHIQNLLSGALEYQYTNPTDMTRQKNKAVSNVNSSFKGASTRFEEGLAARGFEKSGTLASGLAEIEKGRGSAIGDIESEFADKEIRQKNYLLEMMQRFGFGSAGSSSTATGPNTMYGDAIGDGLETALSLYTLNEILGKNQGIQYELPGGGVSGRYPGGR
jgi:hypothetical protein